MKAIKNSFKSLFCFLINLSLLAPAYSQADDCDIWLESMQEEVQKGETEEAIKMMNWYISCMGENMDSKDPRLRLLLNIRYIDKFEGDYAFCLLRSGKTGIVNKDLSELTELPYHEFGSAENGLRPAIAKSGHVVLIDNKGRIIKTTMYDMCDRLINGLLPVRKGDKWGLIDTNVNEIIPLRYDMLMQEQKGKFWVTTLDKKKGLVNRNGKEILPKKYNSIYFVSESLIRADLDGKWGVVDTLTNIKIPFKYDLIWGSTRGYKVEIDKKAGYIDYNGKEIIPLIYESAYEEREDRIRVQSNDKYGYIDWAGREIIPIKYDKIEKLRGGLLKVTVDGRQGVIDKEGREIIPPIHEWVSTGSEGFTQYGPLVGKRGLIDSTGLKVLDIKYDKIGPFVGDLAYVRGQEKYGYVDKNGAEIIPLIYDKAESFREGLALTGIQKPNPQKFSGFETYYGYIDPEGKEVIPHRYVAAKNFSGGVAVVLESWGRDGWKLIDKRGNILTPSGYDDISFQSLGLLAVQNGDKWGYLNTLGDLVIPLRYDKVSDFYEEGVAGVTVDNKSFFINKRGECVLDCENAPAGHP